MTARTADPGSPIDIYTSVLTEKYADFTGRARRAEFWWFNLVNFGVLIVLGILGQIGGIGGLFALVGGLYALAVIVPGIAIAVRRLHDTNKSGWMLLIGLIPLVGAIILLVFYFTDSDRGANNYGPSPKYMG
ncbi:MAG TPA: DUF805 domain-containing protein [Acidimicrobiia bacterium]|jgi:uncharacterized membrane protein YhaH (DUF805 family)|nr:DUF805 domain-containing protein [Acidimicrobiia bacterium]